MSSNNTVQKSIVDIQKEIKVFDYICALEGIDSHLQYKCSTILKILLQEQTDFIERIQEIHNNATEKDEDGNIKYVFRSKDGEEVDVKEEKAKSGKTLYTYTQTDEEGNEKEFTSEILPKNIEKKPIYKDEEKLNESLTKIEKEKMDILIPFKIKMPDDFKMPNGARINFEDYEIREDAKEEFPKKFGNGTILFLLGDYIQHVE